METETVVLQPAASGTLSRVRALLDMHLELAKAKLSLLVVLTAAVGYVLASGAWISWLGLLATVWGTALAAAGANGLNQWLEAVPDALMRRTRHRPIPSRRMSERYALVSSLFLAVSGIVWLDIAANRLTALLGLATVLLYVLVYTPLKRKSTACTLVGAVVGAVPPLMGWAAAVGTLEVGAWILAALLFVWQIPHFLALAWMCRQDYERGGFRMLPLVDPTGVLTCRMIVLYCTALLPAGLALTLAGVTGWRCGAGILALGCLFLALGVQVYRRRTDAGARRVFLASVLYLPLALALMVVDRNVHAPVEAPLRSYQSAQPAPSVVADAGW